MQLKDNIYIVVNEAISINHASIVEENSKYFIVEDKLAEIIYIVLFDIDVDLSTLIINAKKYQDTIAVISKYDFVYPHIDLFNKILPVRQFSYHGDYLDINNSYPILEVTIDDLSYIKSHYIRIGDDDTYLIKSIARGMLKIIDNDNSIMGFIGEHPEHAMGMLYIDEKYRRRGLGRTLEKALINKFIKEGKIPFDHVVLDNNKSLNLQSSIEGMKLDEGFIVWYF